MKNDKNSLIKTVEKILIWFLSVGLFPVFGFGIQIYIEHETMKKDLENEKKNTIEYIEYQKQVDKWMNEVEKKFYKLGIAIKYNINLDELNKKNNIIKK